VTNPSLDRFAAPPPDPALPLSPQAIAPALVAFLLQDGKVTPEVFSRALLALAEDGWLHIEPQDSGVPVVRIVQLPPPDQVRAHERVALERVVRRTGSAPAVPLSALTSSEGDDYEPWWKRFTEAVKRDAAAAGLLTGRLRPRTACGVPAGLGLAAALFAVHLRTWSGIAVVATGLGACYLAAIVVNSVGRPKLTPQAKAAALWWREHGGGLGGAVISDRLPAGAQPSPHTPEAVVRDGSAPLPEGYVWSSFRGRWHVVKVGPTKARRWGTVGSAVMLLCFAAFFSAVLGVFSHAMTTQYGTLIALSPLAAAAALLAGSWVPAHLRLRAVPKRATFTGQIVKRWTYEVRGEDSSRTVYCVCIDDGVSLDGWSFAIPRKLYATVQMDEVVHVDFNPRKHRINTIEPAPLSGRQYS
jgi:hypothetical protein